MRSPEPTAGRPCLSAPAVHLKNSFSSLSPAASACGGDGRKPLPGRQAGPGSVRCWAWLAALGFQMADLGGGCRVAS